MRISARVALAIIPLMVACAGGAPARPVGQPGPEPVAAPQRPIIIGFAEEPASLEPAFGQGGRSREYAALLSAFLAYLTPDQQPAPYLAAELPSLDRGTWVVRPDGRAETTYRLNPRATWHDGQPVTAQDFVFAHRVHLDPAVPTTRLDVDRRMAAVTAVDDQTLFIEWTESYLWAGMVFSPNFSALPSHLLEPLYRAEDKTAFVNGSHWNRDFVGTGPYRVERWEQGAELVLRAHDGFVLGKPRTDLLVLKFVADGNTIVANLLAGSIDTAFYSGLTFTQARSLEEGGWPGTVAYWRGSADWLEFQTRDWGNLQRAVLDVRVRRALIYAIDRRAIIDGLYAGKATVHHFWLAPDDPAYPAVDRAVQKYEYDAGRAAALLREAGWTRGADGQLRDAAGEVLTMPLVSEFTELEQRQATVVVDNWKALGIPPEVRVLTVGQQRDLEFRSKLAAAGARNRGLGYDAMVWTNDQVTSPENRWRGNNNIGYVNPVVDELWPRVMVTPDLKAREALLVDALRAMTADAVVNVTDLQPRAIAHRAGLVGPRPPWSGEGAFTWNAWEWGWEA
jgi:peptide/nickel transport system substrate-binding protein